MSFAFDLRGWIFFLINESSIGYGCDYNWFVSYCCTLLVYLNINFIFQLCLRETHTEHYYMYIILCFNWMLLPGSKVMGLISI